MTRCLWCSEEMIITLNWQRLYFLSERKKLCDTCTESLHVLHGKRCSMCSRESNSDLCSDCTQWSRLDNSLTRNHSVFGYNEMMQTMIARWKYRGDYILGKAFTAIFEQTFKTFFPKIDKETLLVPIPLSDKRLLERGFNQAHMLATCLPGPNVSLLKRVHSEKQSKKTRYERLTTDNPFQLCQSVPAHTKIILIDDIYTTGTTLRHAAATLKQAGASDIYAYTLIRG